MVEVVIVVELLIMVALVGLAKALDMVIMAALACDTYIIASNVTTMTTTAIIIRGSSL